MQCTKPLTVMALSGTDPAMVSLDEILPCLSDPKPVDCKQPVLCMLQYQSPKMLPE